MLAVMLLQQFWTRLLQLFLAKLSQLFAKQISRHESEYQGSTSFLGYCWLLLQPELNEYVLFSNRFFPPGVFGEAMAGRSVVKASRGQALYCTVAPTWKPKIGSCATILDHILSSFSGSWNIRSRSFCHSRPASDRSHSDKVCSKVEFAFQSLCKSGVRAKAEETPLPAWANTACTVKQVFV